MPIFGAVGAFFSLVSLLLLGGGGYLIWSWTRGAPLVAADGEVVLVREAWRFWCGAALLGWSFFGRAVVLALAARRGEEARPPVPEGEASPLAGLHVQRAGAAVAQPIIFTHAWGLDGKSLEPIAAALADRFQTIIWDLPGLGRSRNAARRGHGPADLAEDLARLVERCGPRRPVLVGHSIGGMAILALLDSRPDLHARIAGVVLVHTTYENPLRTMIASGLARALQQPLVEPACRLGRVIWPVAWLAAWQSYLSGSAHLTQRLGFGRFVTRRQLDRTALAATRNHPGVQADGNLGMIGWSGWSGRFEGPMLVIGGGADIVTLPRASEHIAAQGPGQLRIIEDANHLGPIERPDRYAEMIGQFALAVLEPTGGDRSPPQPRPEAVPRSWEGPADRTA